MHAPSAAAVEGLNDYRTGVYAQDDLPGAVLVLVFVDGKPREIGRFYTDTTTSAVKRRMDDLVTGCFAGYANRNGIGDRKVVRIAAKSEYAYPTQFECPWCGAVRLGYDIQRPDTISIGRCSHYVIWVTRPDYDTARGMQRLGWHLTYQRRPAMEAI